MFSRFFNVFSYWCLFKLYLYFSFSFIAYRCTYISIQSCINLFIFPSLKIKKTIIISSYYANFLHHPIHISLTPIKQISLQYIDNDFNLWNYLYCFRCKKNTTLNSTVCQKTLHFNQISNIKSLHRTPHLDRYKNMKAGHYKITFKNMNNRSATLSTRIMLFPLI